MRSSAKHYVSVSVDLERGYLTQKKYIFKQFDNLSRVINFKLTNKSRIDLTDKKVYVFFKKADRNVVMLDGIIRNGVRRTIIIYSSIKSNRNLIDWGNSYEFNKRRIPNGCIFV